MPVKLLITYNVKPAREEAYYRFVMGEFLPALQNLGLTMVEGWHTAWGDYPQRLIGLAAESQNALEEILGSERWREIENELAVYVSDYQRRTVLYRSGFQFFKPR
jgi:hypothetical protein